VFFKSKAGLYALFVMLLLAFNIAHAALVAIPELKSRITDLTQTLSVDQQAQLDAKLAAFEQQKGSQIAILIVPTTQPEDIAQYSIRVAENWKVGRAKIDDGILLLVAKEDRKIRLEVGYGLEGAIPDLTAKRVINEIISPQFKQGNFYGGLDAGVDKLIGLINGEALPEPKASATGGNAIENLLPILLFGGLISGLVLRSLLGNFAGSAVNGSLVGAAVWLLGLALGAAVIFAIVAFFFTMMMGSRGMGGYGGMPMGGGGFGGGSSSWGGGGGGFGGGGASGDW
jgi:uncharacterized protein